MKFLFVDALVWLRFYLFIYFEVFFFADVVIVYLVYFFDAYKQNGPMVINDRTPKKNNIAQEKCKTV